MGNKGKWISYSGAIVLLIAGILALLKVFYWGEEVTHYGAWVPWGLWVSLYIFLVGTAAGAAWTGAYSYLTNSDKSLRMPSVSLLIAAVCLAFGLAFIGIDLGKPLNGVRIFLHPTFTSKLAWASWLYLLFFLCVAGYFFTKAKGIFLSLASLAAVGFLTAEGLFFGSMVSRPMWHTWLTPAAFFTSGAVSGLAMVYLVSRLDDKVADRNLLRNLPKFLLYALILHAAVEGIHFLTGLGEVEKGVMLKHMWASWTFWGLFLLAGVAAPIVMLLRWPEASGLTPFALSILGIIAYKYNFIRYGFILEPLPGITAAHQTERLSMAYFPSFVEWAVSIGFVAGVLAVALMTVRYLLQPSKA